MAERAPYIRAVPHFGYPHANRISPRKHPMRRTAVPAREPASPAPPDSELREAIAEVIQATESMLSTSPPEPPLLPVRRLQDAVAQLAAALDKPAPLDSELREQLHEFDAWLSFRAEFGEVLRAFRSAFGTDTSTDALDKPAPTEREGQ